MIRNIVFDMGQVLIHFDWDRFVSRLGLPPEDRRLLTNELFQSLEWPRLDRGVITYRQAHEAVCQRLPARLHGAAWELLTGWYEPILPMEGMAELVGQLKAAGYGIYLLSNTTCRFSEYWPQVPGHEYFDGLLLSFEYGLLKPERAIYLSLFDRFRLQPEECFFVDDQPSNIEEAFRCGMPGAVFHGDAEDLRVNLRRAGVRI